MMSMHNVVTNPSVIMQTFFLVGSAEIFDKTFFIAMVLTMQHRRFGATVFTGCFIALVAHVFMAALCGIAMAHLMSPRALDFAAAGLYAVFAVMYARDYCSAEEDGMCEFEDTKAELEEAGYGAVDPKKKKEDKTSMQLKVLSMAFITCFLGEFGDRTQFAMIGQAASQPVVPVCLGGIIAFFVLCTISVLSGLYLSSCAVTERQVCLIGGISFAVFAGLSLYDGFHTPVFREPVVGGFMQLVKHH